jgi:hypothetical protein
MNTPIIITIIICATILLITAIALLFVMWVITKGIAMSEKK